MLRRWRQRRDLEKRVDAVYSALVAHIREPRFYEGYGVPDTLDGRFELLIMHLHLVLRRLRDTGDGGGDFAQELFDTAFRDMDQSLREIGVSDVGVGKKVKEMAKAHFGRAAAYDEALEPGGPSFAEALERNLYGTTSVDGEVLARMADYVTGQIAHLAKTDAEGIKRGELSLASVP